ncbi:MAG: acylphosphatase [Nanoarchaeota archaeon]
MKKSVRLTIQGSMQPVFFNRFVKEKAEALGVRGFVRNKDDGTVEVFLEGNTNEVNEMILTCKTGPQHAMIRSTNEKEEKFQDFRDFRIMEF